MIKILLYSMIAGFFGFLACYLIFNVDEYLVIAYSFAIVVPSAALCLSVEKRDPLSPLHILTYILVVSSPVFSIYVHFFATGWRASYSVFWQSFDDLIPGINITLTATVCLLVGYIMPLKRTSFLISRARQDVQVHASKSRMLVVVFAVLIVATFANIMYALDVDYTTSLADNVLARKSVHEATVGNSVRGSALTHWRLLGINLPHATIIVYLGLIWLKKIPFNRLDGVLIFLLFLVAAVIPFIASSRTPILEIVVVAIMMWHYIVKKIDMVKMVFVGLVALIFIGTMGELRRNPDSLSLSSLTSSLEDVVGASYFIDLGKTSVVVNNVPEQVDYLYGASLVSIGVALIPRQLWPEKPVVRIGHFVGQEIIGLNNQTGIPPGFIGEVYLNFGYLGVFPIFFVVGTLMRRLYSNMRYHISRGNRSFGIVVTYVLGLEIIANSLLTTDLTYALIQLIAYSFPLYIISRFVSRNGYAR